MDGSMDGPVDVPVDGPVGGPVGGPVDGATERSDAVVLERVGFRWPGGTRDVLAIESLRVSRGERVFIRGPSGSGKTTLLSLIGGVVRPDTGTVAVDGVALASLSGGARDAFRAERIGFVFQMFNLLPFLGLVDNVLLPCRFSPQRRARVHASGASLADEARRLLRALRLDVEALERRPVAQLSVGQQQRVAVARALIGSPPIIVADEPTSALDADARHDFLELLFGEVGAVGATLLFVSHDRGIAEPFDRTIDLETVNRAGAQAA